MDENDRQHSSEAQSIDDEGIRTNKRKSDDGASPYTRTKRNRYVSVAWCGLNSGSLKANRLLPCNILTPFAAMNVRGGRSNAMAKFLVSVAAACVWNACTHPIAAVVASRILGEQLYAPVEQCYY